MRLWLFLSDSISRPSLFFCLHPIEKEKKRNLIYFPLSLHFKSFFRSNNKRSPSIYCYCTTPKFVKSSQVSLVDTHFHRLSVFIYLSNNPPYNQLLVLLLTPKSSISRFQSVKSGLSIPISPSTSCLYLFLILALPLSRSISPPS